MERAALHAEEVLRRYTPEEILSSIEPVDELRYYGLDRLLRHLRYLTPAERAELEW